MIKDAKEVSLSMAYFFSRFKLSPRASRMSSLYDVFKSYSPLI
jgi:hypothetical protein